MDIISKYQKYTPMEHILKRPGMYIGGVDKIDENIFVFDNNKIIEREISFSPGIYKIFDEIIVNAYDQTIRDKTVSKIMVSINKDKNLITIENDGRGIDVVIHPKHKIYVPELIFGNLLTSTSFSDKKGEYDKVTGGIHGLGAKLTAIFSTYFKVEIGDAVNKKMFKQTFKKNLSIKSKPIVSNYNKDNGYVKISFQPDLKYFKYDKLDNNLINLFIRRVYDLCALTPVKIYLNKTRLDIKNFENYVKLYYENQDTIILSDICSDRWKFIISNPIINSDTKFMSFVNGIYTNKGGKHVEYIQKKIIKGLKDKIYKKFKKIIPDQFIKNNIFLFLVCSINEPTFSSQSKDELMTPVNKFGSECTISDNFIKKIYDKLNFDNKVKEYITITEKQDLSKLQVKKKSIIGKINKLNDANYAGTSKSNLCTLILTEGDSAKAMAISGLSVINKANNYYGIFPLKGKLLNVREASHKQILKNEEFINIRKIIGLQIGQKYTIDNIKNLRYRHVVLMMDADVDGSHIKGLFINIIDHYWPELLKIEGFLKIFITPAIKTSKNNKINSFYSLKDYKEWIKQNNEKGWKIKYYKGLGTNTGFEAKEYFKNLDKNIISLYWTDKDNQAIKLAFDKNLVDDRKKWLQKYDEDKIIDFNKKKLSYYDFIHKELIHFSIYDNIRSIPNIIDGFKPSQRKILFASFKRDLIKEIKVAQLIGYISEHTAYHHGENSLAKTIISMAQNFVGSNNINLFKPIGQFGTRLSGGKDYSSPRYIFTHLEPITRLIFNKDDDELLNYLQDDGYPIEPEYYIPIIPMVLVNGAEGIGTGYSTYIPKFNPIEIVQNIKNKLNNGKFKEMKPFYKQFTGIINKIDKYTYESKGIIENRDNEIIIKELPITYWTENYKTFLENNITDRYLNNSTDSTIEFIIKKKYIEFKDNDFEKKFSITNRINLTNMYLFDKNKQIKKYDTVVQILDEFYELRLEYYKKRKQLLLDKLEELLKIFKSKIKFINDILNKKLNLYNLPKDKIINILKLNKFYLIKEEQPYDYLIKMSFYSFSKEKITELQNKYKDKKKEFDNLNKIKIEQMYSNDLDILLKNLYKK